MRLQCRPEHTKAWLQTAALPSFVRQGQLLCFISGRLATVTKGMQGLTHCSARCAARCSLLFRCRATQMLASWRWSRPQEQRSKLPSAPKMLLRTSICLQSAHTALIQGGAPVPPSPPPAPRQDQQFLQELPQQPVPPSPPQAPHHNHCDFAVHLDLPSISSDRPDLEYRNFDGTAFSSNLSYIQSDTVPSSPPAP